MDQAITENFALIKSAVLSALLMSETAEVAKEGMITDIETEEEIGHFIDVRIKSKDDEYRILTAHADFEGCRLFSCAGQPSSLVIESDSVLEHSINFAELNHETIGSWVVKHIEAEENGLS